MRHRRYTSPEDVRAKIIANVRVDEKGCWVWQRYIHAGTGYAKITWRGMNLGHRVSFTAFGGELIAGMEIDHICFNRACVNPAHLEQVSHRENNIRAGRRKRKDYCGKGHPLFGDNLYSCPSTPRICRTCANERARRYRARLSQKEAKQCGNV